MVFTPPAWVPEMPFDPPDSIPICDFMLDERYGRRPLEDSRPPLTCGLTGFGYTAIQVKDRVDKLASALSKELGWQPNKGSEWDKVAGVFSVNTIDTVTLAWAIHRLSGISSPANAAYSLTELEHQVRSSGATALFTCQPLLPLALEAASKCNIPKSRVFLLSVPKAIVGGQDAPSGFKTIDQLIQDGESLPELEPLRWKKGQGARQTAFLCYSSGTSGLPKGVMISHRNVIANTLQIATFEEPYRQSLKKPGEDRSPSEITLGLLPQSHIYALVVICHASIYRGDQVVNLPKFELSSFLNAIQRFQINSLYLVSNPGSAEDDTKISAVAGSPNDIWFGSSGSLLPMVEARIMSADGTEITAYNQPGELAVRSPSVVLGYLNNDKANRETFENGWMRTGDVALFRKHPNGAEHCFIVDRMKELIKVKGMQVAPAELESHLLTHPAVADCAVIPVPDEAAGELPKAFVVKSPSVGLEENDRMLIRDIQKHVEKDKARHKWLKGGVTFLPEIPKSPSGKILRRMLKDKERESRRQQGPKL
ncbi:MAG: hypothetical protein L6R37_003478 [Teloschistes peruensis]|nr:MAG: hypothetical protein L6R37_003478 [Teloschistes peruensis]